MVREFAKIATSLWWSEKFNSVGDREKLLYLYLLSCTHGNSAGCYVLPEQYVCIDLSLPQDTVYKDLDTLSKARLIRYNRDTSVLYIPNFLRHSPVMNSKHGKGLYKLVSVLPDCEEKQLGLFDLLKSPYLEEIRNKDSLFGQIRNLDQTQIVQLTLQQKGVCPQCETDLSSVDKVYVDHGPVNENGQLPGDPYPQVICHSCYQLRGRYIPYHTSTCTKTGTKTGTDKTLINTHRKEQAANKDSDGAALKAAVSLWNQMAAQHGLAQVQRLTSGRRTSLRARLKEAGGLGGWEQALLKVPESRFLMGGNDRHWFADFDFVLRQKNFTKLMEGGYEQRQTGTDRDNLHNDLREWTEGGETGRGNPVGGDV